MTMAMTRKEKAEMRAAIEKAELLAALRWTSQVERDVAPPESYSGHSEGWDFNSYNKKVFKAWSENVSNGTGEYQPVGKNRIGSQGSVWLFSTRKRALAAMRQDIETKSARELLEIDRMMKGYDE
jgi:hypothetical protein